MTHYYEALATMWFTNKIGAWTTWFAEGPAGFNGGLSAGNYVSLTKTSPATARRDLAELVKLSALVRTGDRKATRYHLENVES